MKTAEEILDNNLYNKFDDTDRQTFLNAMKEYAEQVIEECTKEANVSEHILNKDGIVNHNVKVDKIFEYKIGDLNICHRVDNKSILNVKNKLK